MPGASGSHFDMNVAQAPQGPILKDFRFLPTAVKSFLREKLQYLFNPKVEAPYSGLHLIKQNLNRDTRGGVDITILEYPTEKELLRLVSETRLKIIGISVGCENRAVDANELAVKLRKASLNSDVEVVLGNFGAASGKKAGVMTCEEDNQIHVLWDPPEKRDEIEREKGFAYMGEGVRDMRIFIKNKILKLGIPMYAEPDDPKISLPVSDKHLEPKGSILNTVHRKLGLGDAGFNTYNIVNAVGCGRKCDFCNNRFMFGEKETFIETPDELFAIMEQTAMHLRTEENIPELTINIRDENFARPISNLERLCELIRGSRENIRFAAFAELEGLYKYWKKHNHDFSGLAQGGLLTVWIGLEAKKDIFSKRGGAIPDEVKQLVQDIQRVGICVIGSFLVGYDGQTEEDLTEDMEWSFGLNLAARQVMTHSVTSLVSPGEFNDSQIDLPDDRVGHTRKRKHDHLTVEQINTADREWRKRFYIENGPTSLSSLMTLWNGYKALRDSKDSNDIKASTFFYWKVKNYSHQISIMTMGLNQSVFESHSDIFLRRVVQFLKELEASEPPDNELSKIYQCYYEKSQSAISPVFKDFVEARKKVFVRKMGKK